MTKTKPDGAQLAADLGADVEPHWLDPIPTSPADLDDGKRSTEAGAGFAVVLVVSLLAVCAGLWSLASNGVLR